MGTNCVPLVADLFLFCYEKDFMKDLSSDNQAEVIKAFNSTSRYLDDLLTLTILILKEWSTNFIYLNCNLIRLILQIPRPPFVDLHLSISNGYVSSKIYDKRDDFDFDIVNFPFLDARPKAIHFSWLGAFVYCLVHRGQLIIFFCFRLSVVLFDKPGISIRIATHCICRVLVFASL